MDDALIQKRGRPTTFQESLAEEICERIAEGESVAKICKDERMPALRTVWRWMRQHAEFRHNYEEAKEACEEFYAQNILEIADDVSLSPNDRRIMIDARKWYSGRMKPKPESLSGESLNDPYNLLSIEELETKKKELYKEVWDYMTKEQETSNPSPLKNDRKDNSPF